MVYFFRSSGTYLPIERSFGNIPGILHLLDDFLIDSKSLASSTNDLQVFLKTCDELVVPIVPEKTVGPSFMLSFAGIELDTQNMEAQLPSNKLMHKSVENPAPPYPGNAGH